MELAIYPMTHFGVLFLSLVALCPPAALLLCLRTLMFLILKRFLPNEGSGRGKGVVDGFCGPLTDPFKIIQKFNYTLITIGGLLRLINDCIYLIAPYLITP